MLLYGKLDQQIEQLKKEETNRSSIWRPDAQFKWIRDLSSNAKGRVGEKLFSIISKEMGKKIENRKDTTHDLLVDGEKHEIKLATLNENRLFKWGHIRTGYDYEILTLIGVYPNNLRIWNLSKFTVHELSDKKVLIPFKVKSKNKSDIHLQEDKYLPVKADDIPSWMNPYELAL